MNQSNFPSVSIEYKHPLSKSFTLEDFSSVCINESSLVSLASAASSEKDKYNTRSCGNIIIVMIRKLYESWTTMRS